MQLIRDYLLITYEKILFEEIKHQKYHKLLQAG